MKMNEIKFETSAGDSKSLKDYPSKAKLIVNVASKCGLTPQYEGLQKLYDDYKDQGLEIIGFPCNQFAGQEPGSNDEIQSFCSVNYGVTFPVMGKIDVNGKGTHPLYKQLKKEAKGVLGTESIKWNFTKFLVDNDGKVTRFSPQTDPKKIAKDIEKALK